MLNFWPPARAILVSLLLAIKAGLTSIQPQRPVQNSLLFYSEIIIRGAQ
jgi:hypothetical protein